MNVEGLVIELANDCARLERELGLAIQQREDWARSCMYWAKRTRELEKASRAPRPDDGERGR
jgi:hypothetical protein